MSRVNGDDYLQAAPVIIGHRLRRVLVPRDAEPILPDTGRPACSIRDRRPLLTLRSPHESHQGTA